MFQPNDKIDPTPSENTNVDLNADNNNLENIDHNVSPRKVAAHKNQIEKVFVKLIVFGLIFGAILSVGAYFILNKLGLTKKPYEIEREKIEQQSLPSSEEIRAVPRIPKSVTEI